MAQELSTTVAQLTSVLFPALAFGIVAVALGVVAYFLVVRV